MPYFPRPWPVRDPLWGLPCHSLPLGLRQTIHSKTKNITSAKHWNKQKRKQIPRLKKIFFCSGRPSIPGCSWPASPLGGAWSSGRRGLRVADGAMLGTCRDWEHEGKTSPSHLLPAFSTLLIDISSRIFYAIRYIFPFDLIPSTTIKLCKAFLQYI